MSTESHFRTKPLKKSATSTPPLTRAKTIRKAKAVRTSGTGVRVEQSTTTAAFGRVGIYEGVVEILDVKRADRPAANTLLDVHKLVQRGLPSRSLSTFVNSFDRIKPIDIYAALGISGRTAQRQTASTGKLLNSEYSSRLWNLAEVMAFATRVLGTAAAAELWLDRPAVALNGNRPLDLMKTIQGSAAVKDLLGRLEHGVYT